jgi:cytochrome c biogenesis protein CcdA
MKGDGKPDVAACAALAALILLSFISIGYADVPQDRVTLVLFYNQHCSDCQRALTFLSGFTDAHPEVTIDAYDIFDNETNRLLFQEFSTRYGVPHSPVPTIFTGSGPLVGYEAIESRLSGAVEELQGNASWSPPQVTEPVAGSTTYADITVPVIITAALIDGINPCAFAVLVFLLLSLAVAGTRARALAVGSAYILAVFLFYFFSGIGLFTVIQIGGVSRILAVVAICIAFLAGALSIRDAFSGGDGPLLSIPSGRKEQIEGYVRRATLPAGFILGVLVGIFELPCTGGIYLAIISLLSSRTTLLAGLPLLLLYNAIFILPLIVILLLVVFGVPVEKMETWRTSHRRAVRVLMGLVMIGLGVFMLVTLL